MKAHIKWPTYYTNIKPGGLTFVENCITLFQILLRIVHSDSEQREGRTEQWVRTAALHLSSYSHTLLAVQS